MLVVITIQSFVSFMILLFVAIVTRSVSHMKLKLLTIVGHQSSTLVLCRVPFACSFGCCVMPLFVLFLLTISLSFLLRLTASGYPFAIFNHFLRWYNFWIIHHFQCISLTSYHCSDSWLLFCSCVRVLNIIERTRIEPMLDFLKTSV